MTAAEYLDKFIEDRDGGTYGFPDGQYVGECLSLAKLFIQEHYGIYPPASGCNGARCYWSMFPDPLGTVLKKIPNTPDLIPKKGWIAVWNGNAGGGYGHIGMVTEANVNEFVSFDQNYYGRQAHLVKHNYNNVDGFLAPLNEETPSPEPQPPTSGCKVLDWTGIEDPDESIEKLIKYLGQKDSKSNWGSDRGAGYLGQEREKNRILTEENEALKQQNTKLTEELVDTRGEVTSAKTSFSNLQKTYNNFISQLAKKLGTAGDESSIIGEVERMLSSESDTSKKVKDLQKAMDVREGEYKTEINTLKSEIESQNKKLEQMISDSNKKNIEIEQVIKQNDNLIQRIDELEEEKETTKRVNTIIADIINFFKRGK